MGIERLIAERRLAHLARRGAAPKPPRNKALRTGGIWHDDRVLVESA